MLNRVHRLIFTGYLQLAGGSSCWMITLRSPSPQSLADLACPRLVAMASNWKRVETSYNTSMFYGHSGPRLAALMLPCRNAVAFSGGTMLNRSDFRPIAWRHCSLLAAIATVGIASLAARGEDRDDRLARSPREVAQQLAAVYGQKLEQVAYIPALPLVAKLRLSVLSEDETHRAEVSRIVAPFLSGARSPVPKSGSEQAGHLIFAELAAGRGKRPPALGEAVSGSRRSDL